MDKLMDESMSHQTPTGHADNKVIEQSLRSNPPHKCEEDGVDLAFVPPVFFGVRDHEFESKKPGD